MTGRGAGARMRHWMVTRSIVTYLFAAWCIVPILWLLSISLKPPGKAFSGNPFRIFTPTLSNYQGVLEQGNVLGGLERSAEITVLSVAIGMALAAPLAYVLTHVWEPASRRSERVTLLFLASLITPPVVLILPLYQFFNYLHLINNPVALVLMYSIMNMSLSVLLLRSYLGNVPHEIREAALVDGAGEWRILLRCILPVAMGGVAATAILCAIQTWNEFLFALVILGGQNQTLPVVISSFLTFEGINWGGLAAAGIMAIVPIVVFGLLVQRHLARGLSFGSIK
jgi:ABC-type glycerol-3-phosphate transport system permease component